jgi:hypothetical protein
MDADKKGLITETKICQEARLIFACMVSEESKRRDPDYLALAKLAFDAAKDFQDEAVSRGHMRIQSVE